jgi:hypothetical protein
MQHGSWLDMPSGCLPEGEEHVACNSHIDKRRCLMPFVVRRYVSCSMVGQQLQPGIWLADLHCGRWHHLFSKTLTSYCFEGSYFVSVRCALLAAGSRAVVVLALFSPAAVSFAFVLSNHIRNWGRRRAFVRRGLSAKQ